MKRKNIEIILTKILDISICQLYTKKYVRISMNTLNNIFYAIRQRMFGMPLQYILRSVTFRNLKLFINNNVFIPRPETEQLVDIIINYIKFDFNKSDIIKVVDVGTGSGAIALSIASECENTQVTALDYNLYSILCVNKNLQHYKLKNLEVLYSNLLFKLSSNDYDIMIANLPYISDIDYYKLPIEIKNFEPSLALKGGYDGLQCIIKFLFQAIDKIKSGGLIFLEIGLNQLKDLTFYIKKLFLKHYAFIKILQDFNGIDRFIVLMRI